MGMGTYHPDWIDFCWKEAYEQNPAYLLRAFLYAREAGEQIPEWVLKTLEEAFASYFQNEEISLDAALGLVVGPGKSTVRAAVKRHERDWEIVTVMDALIRLGMEGLDAAIVAVECTRHLSPPDPRSAKDMFYRWKKFRLDELAQKGEILVEVSVNGCKHQRTILPDEEARAYIDQRAVLQSAPDEVRRKYPAIFTV